MFLGTLLPVRCPGCGSPDGSPCRRCAALLLPPPAGPVPRGLAACWSLFAYEGLGRLIVTSLKYRRDRAGLAGLAAGMAGLAAPPPGVVVTWAPTTSAGRRRRGFDQAELLARGVARRWSAPCLPLLARRAGPGQTGRSLADRRTGPLLRARACAGLAAGAPVVVVDDVLTTGSTLTAAADALRGAGVGWTAGLTAARTPWHEGSAPSVRSAPQNVRQFAQVRARAGR